MPYRQSRAKKTFDAEIDNIIGVIREAYSNKHTSTAVREYVLNCSIMLCTAKVENYFEELLTDWAKAINVTNQRAKNLPPNLRAFCLHSSAVSSAYRAFILQGDEKRFLKTFAKTMGNNIYLFAMDESVVPTINPRSLYSNKKYPSPDNIEELFHRVGVDRVFQELNKSAKADIKASVVSFNDIRTAVAHQGIPQD